MSPSPHKIFSFPKGSPYQSEPRGRIFEGMDPHVARNERGAVRPPAGQRSSFEISHREESASGRKENVKQSLIAIGVVPLPF